MGRGPGKPGGTAPPAWPCRGGRVPSSASFCGCHCMSSGDLLMSLRNIILTISARSELGKSRHRCRVTGCDGEGLPMPSPPIRTALLPKELWAHLQADALCPQRSTSTEVEALPAALGSSMWSAGLLLDKSEKMKIRQRFTFLEFLDEEDVQPSLTRSWSLPWSLAPCASAAENLSNMRAASHGAPSEDAMSSDDSRQMSEVFLASACNFLLAAAEVHAEEACGKILHRADEQHSKCAGSIGHPRLCSRPCVHVVKRGVCSLPDCCFCHLPHQNREQKLTKKARALAQSMPKSDFIRMCWRLLHGQLFDVGPEAVQTVHAILSEEMLKEHDEAILHSMALSPGQVWKLQKSIQDTRMNLASLLMFAARCSCDHTKDRLRHVVEQMRIQATEQ